MKTAVQNFLETLIASMKKEPKLIPILVRENNPYQRRLMEAGRTRN
jgi:hypothetical protein